MLRAIEADLKVANARNAAHWLQGGFSWWCHRVDLSSGHPGVCLDNKTDSSVSTHENCAKGKDIVECWSENSSDDEGVI